MRLMKVYDANAKHVDSFRTQKECSRYRSRASRMPSKEQIITMLNKNGFFVRKQLTKSGKSVQPYALALHKKPMFAPKVKPIIAAIRGTN